MFEIFVAKVLVFYLNLNLINGIYTSIDTTPQQVHLSLGTSTSEMVVTWITMAPTDLPYVEYGEHYLKHKSSGFQTEFISKNVLKIKRYVSRVVLTNLKPETTYIYHCGGQLGWSSIFRFTTFPNHTDFAPQITILGDLGSENGQSIPRLQEYVHKGKIDVIIHNGDFAYNLNDDNGYLGDKFMRQIEPIAAFVPYQTVVGNHESSNNFSHYNNIFSMISSGKNFTPGEMNNFFYSFNLGKVHFIAFSTEFYFFIEFGWHQIEYQFKWLEKDLKEANQNRHKQPWIVTLGHRPMYCSTKDFDDCSHKESLIRKGFPIINSFGLEDLFYKYGVDIEIWSHEHMYERMYPVYNREVYKGSEQQPYKDPKAPVHIITGSAGCKERLDSFIRHIPKWSAVRISDYGFSQFQFLNSSHVHIQQISDDKDGKITDEFWIIKNYHGPYENKDK